MAPGMTPSEPDERDEGAGGRSVGEAGVEDRPSARFVSLEASDLVRPGEWLMGGACEVVAEAYTLEARERGEWLAGVASRVARVWSGWPLACCACVLAPGVGGRGEVEAVGVGSACGPLSGEPSLGWAIEVWSRIHRFPESPEPGEVAPGAMAWSRFRAWGAWRAFVVRLSHEEEGGSAPRRSWTVLRSVCPALTRAYVRRFVSPAERRADLLSRLSPAQRRVAELLVAGRSERDIAREIGRSVHTVHDHSKAIYRSWGVKSRRELWERWG